MNPPFRFAMVEHGLYRGAYPTLINLEFLRSLKLKTIVSVVAEPCTRDLREFCEREGIRREEFLAPKFSGDEVSIDPAVVGKILRIACDTESLPLYLHCLDGANTTWVFVSVSKQTNEKIVKSDSLSLSPFSSLLPPPQPQPLFPFLPFDSGIVVMCLRKVQNWSKTSFVSEASRFLQSKGVRLESFEQEFVEKYKIPFQVPAAGSIPPWLWGGKGILEHPTIPLEHDITTRKALLESAKEEVGSWRCFALRCVALR